MISDPVRLSLQVMLVAAPSIFLIGLALAVVLARRTFRGQIAVETLVMLPLVLPPTVLGYGLLRVLGSGSPVREWFGIDILFTWPAAAIAATIAGIPLMVQAARAGVRGVDTRLENVAQNLGAGRIKVLWYVTLPLAKRGIIAGMVLGSLRALGEFGATLMVAGSIPGRTQTMPLAIYDAVQVRDYGLVNQLVLILVALSFAGLFLARRLSQ